MRRTVLIATAAGLQALSLLAASGAGAQEFYGQVKIRDEPAAAAKPPAAATTDLSGVTVTGQRIPESQRDPKEVLCHQEAPIGSRFPVKICARREEFAQRRREDQEQLREWTALRPYKGN